MKLRIFRVSDEIISFDSPVAQNHILQVFRPSYSESDDAQSYLAENEVRFD